MKKQEKSEPKKTAMSKFQPRRAAATKRSFGKPRGK